MRENDLDYSCNYVECDVCPHRCKIKQGNIGICGARGNEDGRIIDLNYGRATALALDPIEKKPLHDFFPGSKILSYGSFGCNLRCKFCQNSDISMVDVCSVINTADILPEALVKKAKELVSFGNIGVAFTYNEPLIAPEFFVDTALLLHEAGLKSVAVANGYITNKTLNLVAPFMDAANVDLKSFTEEGYKKVGAPYGLETVKTTIKGLLEAGVHVEVTTLVVPGISDSENDFEQECKWLSSLDPSITLHISRFFPTYKMTSENPTDLLLMRRFEDIASTFLKNVHLGNI